MLTDAQCRNAVCSPTSKRERLSDSGGLYLEVAPGGSRRWFWKYRHEGKEGRMALGSYPSVSLTAARKARDTARLQKSTGINPVHARKVERLKASASAGDTFKGLCCTNQKRAEITPTPDAATPQQARAPLPGAQVV